MTTRAVRDNELFSEIRKILGKSYPIPNTKGYGGTGGPGRLLEDLLHIQANNQDLPDAGRWELKYTSDTSYLTLFHNDPLPREPSIIKDMVNGFGWKIDGNLTAFRHTIWGKSKRGFKIEQVADKIYVKNNKRHDILPYWDINDLNNAATPKLRNLCVVFGKTHRQENGDRTVDFNSANMYSRFKIREFLNGLESGLICIDFDARTNESGSIRNHGTKFRIKTRDLGLLYTEIFRLTPN